MTVEVTNVNELRNKPCYAVYKDVADEKKYIVPVGSTISVTLPQENGSPVGGYAFDKVPTQWLLIPMDKQKILYDGRYCAVVAFIYTYINGEICVLVNKRGENAPDYKHCWNVVCGFLERNENGEDGIKREIFEETGYDLKDYKLRFMSAETEPEECNNGNVSLRYACIVDPEIVNKMNSAEDRGGEEGEVEGVQWLPIDDIDKYQWAFNHKKLITKMYEKLPFWYKLWKLIRYQVF